MNHHSLIEALVQLVITSISVLIVARLLPGMRVRSFGSAFAFAFVVALLNAVLWFFFAGHAYGVHIGIIGSLILNGILFLVAGRIVDGVAFSGCVTAALASVGVAAVNYGIRYLMQHLNWR